MGKFEMPAAGKCVGLVQSEREWRCARHVRWRRHWGVVATVLVGARREPGRLVSGWNLIAPDGILRRHADRVSRALGVCRSAPDPMPKPT
jgi:hypothetical protein